MRNIIKKILAIWISIYLIVVPPFAHAASSGGWSYSKYDIISGILTAMRGGVSTNIKIPTPPPSAVANILKVSSAVAIAYAVYKYGGQAIDWVMSPDAQSVERKVTVNTYTAQVNGVNQTFKGSTNAEICNAYLAAWSGLAPWYYDKASVVSKTEYGLTCYLSSTKTSYNGNGILSPGSTVNDKQVVPLTDLADVAASKAKAGDAEAASIIDSAMRDYVNSGAADVALDAAKADADATHGCGTGTHWSGSACVADTPSTPSTPTTDTPFDPTSILDAIGQLFDAVMSLPDVINNALDSLLADIKDFFQPVVDSVTNFFDWVKTTYDEFVKPDDSPTDVDIDVPQTQTIDTDVNFGGSCPANITGSFVIGGRTTTFNIMDWSQFCLIMSTYLKPLVIALASYQAVKILAGRNESN